MVLESDSSDRYVCRYQQAMSGRWAVGERAVGRRRVGEWLRLSDRMVLSH